jgi:hypothetical protein
VPEQELDLLEVAAVLAAEFRAGAVPWKPSTDRCSYKGGDRWPGGETNRPNRSNRFGLSPLTLILEYVNWNEFKHLEQVYDLKHLRPYTISYERPAKGKRSAEKFSVNITFSHHCFTRGLPRDGSAYDLTLCLDYDGARRIFDAGR